MLYIIFRNTYAVFFLLFSCCISSNVKCSRSDNEAVGNAMQRLRFGQARADEKKYGALAKIDVAFRFLESTLVLFLLLLNGWMSLVDARSRWTHKSILHFQFRLKVESHWIEKWKSAHRRWDAMDVDKRLKRFVRNAQNLFLWNKMKFFFVNFLSELERQLCTRNAEHDMALVDEVPLALSKCPRPRTANSAD